MVRRGLAPLTLLRAAVIGCEDPVTAVDVGPAPDAASDGGARPEGTGTADSGAEDVGLTRDAEAEDAGGGEDGGVDTVLVNAPGARQAHTATLLDCSRMGESWWWADSVRARPRRRAGCSTRPPTRSAKAPPSPPAVSIS